MNETSSLKTGGVFYCALLEVLKCHCASPPRKAVDCVICHPRRKKIKHKGNWLINQSYFWNVDRPVPNTKLGFISTDDLQRLFNNLPRLLIDTFLLFCFVLNSTSSHRCNTLRVAVSTQGARIALLANTKSLHTYALAPRQTHARALGRGQKQHLVEGEAGCPDLVKVCQRLVLF